MKLLLTLIFLVGLAAFTPALRPKPSRLVKVWETDTTLRTPESVLYDEAGRFLYVSNIDGKPDALDGSGFISKVSLDGQITNLHWAGSLNAPKGMGLYKNHLYVTDVYRLLVINTETGQAEKTYDAIDPKNAFLNDVTVDKYGTVYVSDSRFDKLYRLKDDKWELWMQGEQLNKPNGLLALGKNTLLMGSTKIGALQRVDVDTKTITKLADGMGNTDGIVTDKQDNTFVSDWNGQIFMIQPGGQKTQLLDTRADKMNTADMAYVRPQRLLIVPTFYKNKLVAYRVE